MIFQPAINVFLLLLLFAPIAALVVWVLVRAPKDAGRSTAQTRNHRLLWALRLAAVLACFVMLLRPGIPGGATQTLATDTDIVLVVDTTASIVAEDWADGEPRLDGVRADVRTIIAEYPGARFALLTFDAAAELRMPLTTDTTALVGSLDVLRPEVTSQSRGSSIGIAATLLEQTLASAAESSPDRSRMVFYFGDGEQTVSSDPESFAASAPYTDAGAVFGYGTAEGGPMRITSGGVDGTDAGYIQYQGSDALSVVDEQNLQALAAELGVEYEHRTADTEPQLPEAPTTTTNYAESGEVGNVTELYWIAALVLIVLLGIELARAAMLIARLRGLRTPKIDSAGSETGSLSLSKRPSRRKGEPDE
ncbi:vWA domain-containing protein [Microbacterium galbinum]|uniref:VWA domain-containing protein n=1 Tax=Microbacterium galbinum TaxID=2851646 RepID=A0ABY4IQR8_9MICO|nr:VWA domain-containing protein [Microbacterium galbinum]UPL14256.1 VWA domain-containing protein [Microbacterium galbinum]